MKSLGLGPANKDMNAVPSHCVNGVQSGVSEPTRPMSVQLLGNGIAQHHHHRCPEVYDSTE